MLFSVIVPIYKVEKYLNRCVDSVLSQTCGDFELILVDDGSTDACPAICDEYAKQDSRIKVIHKENGGLVSARQAGIRIAQGEYIFNLDGDDALLPDALESAQTLIAQTQADMVCFCYRNYTDGQIGELVENLVGEGLYDREKIRQHIFPKLLCDPDAQHIFYFSWGKALKRELVLKHQLNVNPAISQGEDLACMVPCYLDAETVYMSKKPVYLYTIRTDSLSSTFKVGQVAQVEAVVSGLHKIKENKPEGFDEQIARYSCFMCFVILASAAEGDHFGALKTLKTAIQNSLHMEEIKKARFKNITIKSRIAIFLMKRQWFTLAFYFLNLCKNIKRMRKGGNA